MFSQQIEPLISKAVGELNSFKPVPINGYDRDGLIQSYWQFHQRFKSFKIFPKENANVLDIGSGGGGLFFWKEYMQPLRTDMRMTALDLQKGIHFDKYNHYALFNLDQGDMPFPNKSFDYIFLSHLIEHVKDWKALLEKCNKVLNDDGIIYIETPSKHTVDLPARDQYQQKGFPCTTINFMDDHTHVETVDLDQVNDKANELGMVALEKGYCKNPLLENLLLSFGLYHNDQEVSQYGLWSKLMFSSYIILQKV